jgi:hypothetical protein
MLFLLTRPKKGDTAATPEGGEQAYSLSSGEKSFDVSRLCYYAHILASGEVNGKGGSNQNQEKATGKRSGQEKMLRGLSSFYPFPFPSHPPLAPLRRSHSRPDTLLF